MAIQAAVLFAVATFLTIGHTSSQSCGSTRCSQAYSSSCRADTTCQLYDGCRTSQSSCNSAIGTPQIQTVDCYDTCIKGFQFNASIPFRCCADPILLSETIQVSRDPNLIVTLYAPNEPGSDSYRQNTFCKYNVECPNDNYFIDYRIMEFDLEPPDDDSGNCLDFLRFHFTAEAYGNALNSDLCGQMSMLPSNNLTGQAGSSLMLDFRSNRIRAGGKMFLVLECIDTRARLNLAARFGRACTPSMSARNIAVSNPYNPTLAKEYLERAFPAIKSSSRIQSYASSTNKPVEIAVTRKGAVMYRSRLLIVKENGRIRHIFRNINYIRVYNRIEGHLKFTRSASPRDRDFPGYGFLRVGNGRAQYIQTIADPNVLLNDEEEVIVRTLYMELLNRKALDDERFYFTPPRHIATNYRRVDCSVNKLAEQNVRSCTPGVKAAATFFLEKDTAQGLCSGVKQ